MNLECKPKVNEDHLKEIFGNYGKAGQVSGQIALATAVLIVTVF